jgi:hypothetical protein
LLRRLPSLLTLLALLAVAVACYHYFTGEDLTLPLRLVPHLEALPLTIEQVMAGGNTLPVQANGYLTTFTHDFAGPFTRPDAALLWVALLGIVLAGWLAVVSTLPRPAFVGGMALVIFFLMSVNADLLGVFNDTKQYFLLLALGLLGGTAYGLHAFGDRISLNWRGLLFGVLVAGLGGLLFLRSQFSAAETALHLAAYATLGGMVLLALLVIWLGIENINGLLWLNTQADKPSGRFGLWPFVVVSLLYLGMLGLYYWNYNELLLYPGLHLDPLVLLLPATLISGLRLRRRAATVASWVPYAQGLRQLFPLTLTGAAGALGYALATANGPLLQAAREFTALAFLALGVAFLAYVLLNFAPLLQQRLAVYRVAFEPRRFPFYAMYTLGLLGVAASTARNQFVALDQVQAGFYNELGDLTRQHSETQPDDLSQALLAERYYAESDALDRNNLRSCLGRAALYRFRGQPRNELLALSRALRRTSSDKVSLHVASLYSDPKDFFEAQQILRRGLRDNPGSATLASDMAQLYSHSTLTDSVAFYLDLAQRRAPGTYANRTNQLAFLLSQNLLPEARKRIQAGTLTGDEPAMASNQALLHLMDSKAAQPAAPHQTTESTPVILDNADFALLYHTALLSQTRGDTTLLPALRRAAAQPENSAYSDQLVFSQALLLHSAGQELQARQLLSPLATGSSPSAAYYQQLLGLWQLRQGQYGTAAVQFARAVSNGIPTAAVGQTHALLLAGEADSAQAVATKLLASPDTARQRLGRQLQSQLAVRRSLLAKNEPASLPATIAFATDRAFLQSKAAAAKARSAPAGSEILRQARLAELDSRPADAKKLYAQLLRESPFNEFAVMAAAAFYTQRHDYTAAYEALHRGIEENPESVVLLSGYAVAATQAGLTDYAADAMARLQGRLGPEAYGTLQRSLAAARAARAAASASFAETP